MAIRDSGADTIPSEATLETPLTVEGAEEILYHLVDRGHPVVESRDGALSNASPAGARAGDRSYRANQPPSTGRVTPCT